MNWYGFILGIAIVVGYLLVNRQAKKHHLEQAVFDKLMLVTLVGGVIGARLWHVATDWWLYKDNLLNIFRISSGGLSIFGAVLGGTLSLWLLQGKYFPKLEIKKLLDLMIFGLPVGQAIGRLGNFVNQELYGLPTDLPWGIAIEESKRAVSFEEFTHFHPLFAYEAILVLIGWVVITKSKWQVGSGKYFKWYIAYYLVIRFLLDFIRVQKGVLWLVLGINQWVILTTLIGYFLYTRKSEI